MVVGSTPPNFIHAPIAQLVEQIPLKDKVAGSNPAGSTRIWCGGENPAEGTNGEG